MKLLSVQSFKKQAYENEFVFHRITESTPHCHGPHANLFTEIDLGLGSRMFQSGGGTALGRHSAAYETFWNIRAQRPQSWPKGWGPDLMNLVAVQCTDPSVTEPAGRWFEAILHGQIRPANLYLAQKERRLKQLSGRP